MYKMIEDQGENPDFGAYPAYGLQTPSGRMIRDITAQCAAMGDLIDRLNRLEASEIHIDDLVEDFILSL